VHAGDGVHILTWGGQWLQQSGNVRKFAEKSSHFLFFLKGREEPQKVTEQGNNKLRVVFH
jgi:hypothetical protein